MNKTFLCVVNLIFTLMFTVAATLPQALGEEVVQGADLTVAELQVAQLYAVDLQGAFLQGAFLGGANLRGAILVNANLRNAILVDADLRGAFLQGADLMGADLGGANLQGAILVGADLRGAILVGANLQAAILQGANLKAAILVGADLRAAELQVAQLHGVDLWNARLQGADLQGANLVGANLRGASLYANSLLRTIELVDVRGLKWQPHSEKEVEELKTIADKWDRVGRDYLFKRLDSATATANLEPATFESCLLDEKTEVKCKKAFALAEFRKKLSKELVTLACQSSYTAHGIMRRVRGESPTKESTTEGLATRLQEIRKKQVNKESCPGLFTLSGDDAAELTRLAEQENR